MFTEVIVPEVAPNELARTNYHVANANGTPAPEPGQENTPLLSLLEMSEGRRVGSAEEWDTLRRPEILQQWTRILGKLEPNESDRRWFGDITQVREKDRQEKERYTRIELDIPIEIDFYQHHLLLLPKGQGPGPFPAVIAWTSTSPDYRQPEVWWGEHLASNGYVVLTSWSFIRRYRNETNFRTGAGELLYERFGHWLPMAKMVHDVRREVEYLRSRPEVDGRRIGFIGFSLSAKAAVYVGAFAPEVIATVAVDPHIALNGATNYFDRWYLDWGRKFDDIRTDNYAIPELRGTVQSLLNPDVERPGFERNHHELLALASPRAFLLIGGSQSEDAGRHSDDLQSWGYFNRAKEVYELLGIGERLQFASTDDGHNATGPNIDPAWKTFFQRWLKETPVTTPESAGFLSPADPRFSGMVFVPPGPFLMGSEEEQIDSVHRLYGGDRVLYESEYPQREVRLGAYYIDRTETTQAEYQRFVVETGRDPPFVDREWAAPFNWKDDEYPEGLAEHPVVLVSYFDAVEYCRWAGKALFTEAEWEKAARGAGGAAYPWGDEWDSARLNSASTWGDRELPSMAVWTEWWKTVYQEELRGKVITTKPVGSYPSGASPYGAFDMAGNVFEWVDSWFRAYSGSKFSNPEFGESYRVVRGGD